MNALRNEAIALASTLPEKYLPSVIGLMQSLKNISEEKAPAPVDFRKYMNSGEKLFGGTSEISEYVRELRSERRI